MQRFTVINEDTAVVDSRELLLDNDWTVASHFSGAAFPVENLVVGMECYRTDEDVKYRLTGLSPVTWEAIPNAAAIAKIKVDNAVTADKAAVCTGNAATATTATNVLGGSVSTNGNIMVNGTSASNPKITWHTPNVNHARISMDATGTLHVQDGGSERYTGIKAGNFIGNLSGNAATADNANAVGGYGVGNAAGKIPVYNAAGHLVLPNGAEFWME